MSNHRWNKENICIHCGIKREMKTWKLCMASVGSKDYYQYGTSYVYSSETLKPTRVRPNCKAK